jgi:putative transposase
MIGTLRRELLDRILIVTNATYAGSSRSTCTIFNTTRPHRTLTQLAPAQAETTHPQAINLANFQIRRKTILDGLTNEYQLAA